MISAKLVPAGTKGAGEIDIKIGDTVKVKNTVVEGGKSRVQSYEGIVISIRGRGENATMTVRRVGTKGVGVERTWPLDSKAIVGVELVRHAKNARRAKLYYMRDLAGKMATRV